MKAATVALIVRKEQKSQGLVEVISDEREIAAYEAALAVGDSQPLDRVHEHRVRQLEEDNSFADYVEELVSQPFQKQEIREHGVQWLKSRIRIEEFQRSESEAAQIIAKFAFQLFSDDPEKVDFFLSSPTAQVRIRVFVLPVIDMASDVA